MLRRGRHFLQIPGPTNVPDRVLRAMDRPTIDHRGPEFAALGRAVLEGCQAVFQTRAPVVIFASSGTGAWEAALVNTLDPGDQVLVAETGHFSTLWTTLARRLGLNPVVLPGDWRHGASSADIERTLAADDAHRIRAVLRRPQRDLDRGDQPTSPRCAGHRSDPAPGAADGRHRLLARPRSTTGTTSGAWT